MDNLYSTKRHYVAGGKLSYEGTGYDDANGDFVRHGEGKGYDENGRLQYEGSYVNGKREGQGKQYDENGKLKYEGSFVNNKWEGQGKEYYHNGKLMYEGGFVNNKWKGQGKEYYFSGKLLYEGGFAEGSWSGFGDVYDGAGMRVGCGMFHSGEIVVLPRVAPALKKYHSNEHLAFILDALKGGLADTIKEAVLLYENTMHRQRMEQEQKKQTELLGQLLEAVAAANGAGQLQAALLGQLLESQTKMAEGICSIDKAIDDVTQTRRVDSHGKPVYGIGVIPVSDLYVKQSGKWDVYTW